MVGERADVMTSLAELTSEASDDATDCAEDKAELIDARSEPAALVTASCKELATDSTDEAAPEAEPRTSLAAELIEPSNPSSVVVGVFSACEPLITVSTPTVKAVVGD